MKSRFFSILRNRLNNKRSRFIASFLIISSLSVPLVAFSSPMGGFRHMMFPLWRVISSLNLSSEQRDTLRELQFENRKEIGDLKSRHGKTWKEDFLSELSKDRPNPQRLHKIVEEMSREMEDVAHHTVGRILKAHQTLTPEQRNQLISELRSYRFSDKNGRRQPNGQFDNNSSWGDDYFDGEYYYEKEQNKNHRMPPRHKNRGHEGNFEPYNNDNSEKDFEGYENRQW